MKIKLFIVLITIFVMACNSSNRNTRIDIVSIDQISENEGFLDLPFTITNQKNEEGYLVNTIKAINNADTLEMKISLKEGIAPGFINGVPKNLFVEDGIKFESTGIQSDKLLNMLANKYNVESSNLKLKEKQVFTIANLTQDPIDYK